MCGRFTLTSTPEALAERFLLSAPLIFAPRYNIAPSQDVVAVRVEDGLRQGVWLRWGLIPHWAKDASVGQRMINARSETLASKPAFRDALRKRRCLIPADSFYEWAPPEQGKQPHRIHRLDEELFGIAGLWDRWQDPTGDWIETCTLVTRSAQEPVSRLHDRMPVILDPSKIEAWLDPAREDPDEVLPLIASDTGPELTLHPVSERVNQPSWDVPACLQPVAPLPRQQGLFS